jgi:hypothetical protein
MMVEGLVSVKGESVVRTWKNPENEMNVQLKNTCTRRK